MNMFIEDGQIFLIRCALCGRVNYAAAVATGQCAWCGWKPEIEDKGKIDKEEKEHGNMENSTSKTKTPKMLCRGVSRDGDRSQPRGIYR